MEVIPAAYLPDIRLGDSRYFKSWFCLASYYNMAIWPAILCGSKCWALKGREQKLSTKNEHVRMDVWSQQNGHDINYFIQWNIVVATMEGNMIENWLKCNFNWFGFEGKKPTLSNHCGFVISSFDQIFFKSDQSNLNQLLLDQFSVFQIKRIYQLRQYTIITLKHNKFLWHNTLSNTDNANY